MEKLFTYGTLQNPAVQKAVFGRAAETQPDTLEGYEKDHILLGVRTYPMVRPADGASVEGYVIEVTQAELERVDIYETDAYQRVQVTLKSGEEAWVYCEASVDDVLG